MANLSNELGISKNQKIEILLQMGYAFEPMLNIYRRDKSTGTFHWFNETDLSGLHISKENFKDFVRYKLNKTK